MSMLFDWLDAASRCGDREVEQAARVMKDYYQGVPPKRKTAEQREREEVLARRIQQRKWLNEEND